MVPSYAIANSLNDASLLTGLDNFANTYGWYPGAVPVFMSMTEPSSGRAPFGKRFPSNTLLEGIENLGRHVGDPDTHVTPVVYWTTDGNITTPDTVVHNMNTWTEWYDPTDGLNPHGPSVAAKIYLDQLVTDAQAWNTYATGNSLDPNVILRLNQEMNVSGFPFSIGHSGNTSAAAFVEMWKTIHKYLVADNGCTFLKFFWCPFANANVPAYGDNSSFSSYWPGSSYVHFMGCDVYCRSDDAQWGYSLKSLIANAITVLHGLDSTRPIIIGETAMNADDSPNLVFTANERRDWLNGSYVGHGVAGGVAAIKAGASPYSQVRGVHFFNINMRDASIGSSPNWQIHTGSLGPPSSGAIGALNDIIVNVNTGPYF